MSQFKRLTDSSIPKIQKELSPEALLWQKYLESGKVVKEYGLINKLDLNLFNNDLLVSSLSRICIYNINNMESKKSFQSFTPSSVYWGSYRKSDGKLITSSTEEGKVSIYDTDNSKPLRVLSDKPESRHLGAVRCSEFLSNHQVVSFSDDKHIKIWDIADGSFVQDIGSSKLI